MKHLDLFSGIGGAALAVDAVWPESEHEFCEIDEYCQKLLKLRFPNSKLHGDIRQLTANPESHRIQRGFLEQNKITKFEQVDILTGGFPCQPFSQAGLRKGTSDNRFLWPEMFRVIREFKPRWVVGENVAGLLTIEQGVVFKQVLTDLEAENYEVESFVIPAVAVNAPHRRDRVWFVAKNTKCERSGWGMESNRQILECKSTQVKNERPSWERNWVEVATELCRVDDGLPAELDGLKLSKPKHRTERLKGLGNAWVPQVAIEIMKAIKQIDDLSKKS